MGAAGSGRDRWAHSRRFFSFFHFDVLLNVEKQDGVSIVKIIYRDNNLETDHPVYESTKHRAIEIGVGPGKRSMMLRRKIHLSSNSLGCSL